MGIPLLERIALAPPRRGSGGGPGAAEIPVELSAEGRKAEPECPAVEPDLHDIHSSFPGLKAGNILLRKPHSLRQVRLQDALPFAQTAEALKECGILRAEPGLLHPCKANTLDRYTNSVYTGRSLWIEGQAVSSDCP